MVISQNKKVGEKARVGSKILLTVSQGKEQVKVPSVKGLDMANAMTTLEKLGFKVFLEADHSSIVEKDKVITQNIGAGMLADKGSQIIITISEGPDFVTVPNVKGMTIEKAEQTLKEAGLSPVAEIKCSNSVKEGYIISQDIEANKVVERDTVVLITISAGVANKKGTTQSNANQFGKVTTQGNWIYFSGQDRCLYRMRKDKSDIQSICNIGAVSINVVGEWIYFTDGSFGGIYKIRLDGTQKTLLSSTTSYKVYVEGDWIYYTGNYNGGKLYKMKTDGSSVTEIVKEDCRGYIVNGNWIYYIKAEDGFVYKCRTDGKSRTLVCAGFDGGDLTLAGNKLVAIKNDRVQSVNLDGSNFYSFEIKNAQYSFLNGYDGWVYYLGHDFSDSNNPVSAFYRMKPDGSQKTKILNIAFLNHANTYINVIDGWLYYQNEHDFNAMYRVKIDGTKVERVG